MYTYILYEKKCNSYCWKDYEDGKGESEECEKE